VVNNDDLGCNPARPEDSEGDRGRTGREKRIGTADALTQVHQFQYSL